MIIDRRVVIDAPSDRVGGFTMNVPNVARCVPRFESIQQLDEHTPSGTASGLASAQSRLEPLGNDQAATTVHTDADVDGKFGEFGTAVVRRKVSQVMDEFANNMSRTLTTPNPVAAVASSAATIDLNGVRLRNRLVTSASLLGYGASAQRLIMYGLSPIAQWVPLERFGAVTTRTLTVQPREGHFTLREDWTPTEFRALLGQYRQALRRVDGGWLNAFGWSNIGIDRYFDEYFERTHHLNRIISVGGFSADEFCALVDKVNQRAQRGQIAAVEFNVSCHNVNFRFEEILDEVLARAIPASRHPVIVKLSPDTDYIAAAQVAERHGAAALTAINAVKGLRLDPETGQPLLKNRYGSLSGRAIKPIGLRVVSELREAGIRLPIIATAGIRVYDDCREYFWAGADAVSLGSAAWLAPLPGYLLGPARGARIRHLISQIERWQPPATAGAASGQ